MKRPVLALLSLATLAGCGTAPSAATVVQPSPVSDTQAMSSTKATVSAKDGHLRLTFAYNRFLKEPENFNEVCVQTKIGGIFSSVWLGTDGGLYVKTDNPVNAQEPATWYAVGSVDPQAVKQGQGIGYKLSAGVRLTYSKAHANFPYGQTPAMLNLEPGKLQPVATAPTLVDAK